MGMDSMGKGKEQLPTGINLTELKNADGQAIARLQEKVAKFTGGVPVFIHPFYAQDGHDNGEDRYVRIGYSNQRDAFLKEGLAKNAPLIIFEPEIQYPDLQTKMSRLGNGEVFTVKTVNNKHMPSGGENDWECVINVMKRAGIKHVELGGMFLITYKSEFVEYFDNGDTMRVFRSKIPELLSQFPNAARWLNDDLIPIGCAGHAAIHFLMSGIDVSLSSVATPCYSTEYIPKKLVENDEDF